MEILPLIPEQYPRIAELFVRKFKNLRASTPELPDTFENPEAVVDLFGKLPASIPACVAVQGRRVIGYMAGFIFENMRDAGRKGAFVPEWGHATLEDDPSVYRQLYRAISRQWAGRGVSMHAIAWLAGDPAAEKVWFWNGFGLTVVDGIRSTDPIGSVAPAGWKFRPATEADANRIAALDVEHCQHYSQAPIFMAPRRAEDAGEICRFLRQPPNRYWLAFQGDELGGFLRCEPRADGAADIVVSPQTIALSGAFVRSQYRGQGVASALLDAALGDYATLGFTRCSVDFESFNPQAAALWPRYFHLVTLTAIRVLEWLPEKSAGEA